MKKTKPLKISKTVVSKQNNELLWAGAADLMKKSESEQHQKKKEYINAIAKVIGISPMGVNILGGLPYINNLGLKQKSLEQYHPGAMFEYNWVQRSVNDEDKAICEARISVWSEDHFVPQMPWVVGECSPASLKMGTLKGYQNHIAQTRAENRAMKYLDGLQLHREMLENIAKLHEQKAVDPKTAELAIAATGVSAEEINMDSVPKAPSTPQQNLTSIIQGIYTKVKDKKTAQQWLEAAQKSEDLSAQEKATVVSLLESKIKNLK